MARRSLCMVAIDRGPNDCILRAMAHGAHCLRGFHERFSEIPCTYCNSLRGSDRMR
jgi:hypothetical protein